MQTFKSNPGMLMRAQHVPRSAWSGHIPFAGWLVEAIRPRVFVELGTHRGASYLAICQAVAANALDARCYAVDTWQGDEHAGLYGDEVYEQLDAYHARHYAGFSTLMRMTFDEACGHFEDGSIDLLHVDGLHTYEAVRHDFEHWRPKLSPRAVVLFHDTCERQRDFGVWRFWREIQDQFPTFEFSHSHGLGVAAVGAEVPDGLRTLLEQTGPAEHAQVNALFERLGGQADADLEIARLNAALVHERSLRRQDDRALLEGPLEAHAERSGALAREHVHVLRQDLVTLRSDIEQRADTLARDHVHVLRQDLATLRGDLVEAAATRQQIAEVAGQIERVHAEAVMQLKHAVAEVGSQLERLAAEARQGGDAARADLADTRRELLDASHQAADASAGAVGAMERRLDRLEPSVITIETVVREWQQARTRRLSTRMLRWLGRSPDTAR